MITLHYLGRPSVIKKVLIKRDTGGSEREKSMTETLRDRLEDAAGLL